ncbi:hypothetical protein [Actinacidiphila sp. ITFR-21]|uniref:hypothetical protein n=1 Tax=Actinacidiphila sp. ITFR-21 TaxID=3075199 RepID=UPI00288B7CBF|nr:hypothetical protein [Streptomyces sp. ITFR-21]WNI16927.1 hypothetical protein RLT57_16285 [Streptomyces sp. ITFR-21]
MVTTFALAFFLTATVTAALWLLRIDRRALRPVMTTAALVIAIGGYAAAQLH